MCNLSNLEIGMQSQDSENVQCNLEILRLSRTYTIVFRKYAPLTRKPPPPTDNEVMLYSIMWHWKGGCNRERNCHITCISSPVFCTKAKVSKGGGGAYVFGGHYGIWLLHSIS